MWQRRLIGASWNWGVALIPAMSLLGQGQRAFSQPASEQFADEGSPTFVCGQDIRSLPTGCLLPGNPCFDGSAQENLAHFALLDSQGLSAILEANQAENALEAAKQAVRAGDGQSSELDQLLGRYIEELNQREENGPTQAVENPASKKQPDMFFQKQSAFIDGFGLCSQSQMKQAAFPERETCDLNLQSEFGFEKCCYRVCNAYYSLESARFKACFKMCSSGFHSESDKPLPESD